MSEIRFAVEQAGCDSCAALIRETLEPVAEVHAIDVDEAADEASVRVAFAPGLTPERVDELLAEASAGLGHDYRVRPGSWLPG